MVALLGRNVRPVTLPPYRVKIEQSPRGTFGLITERVGVMSEDKKPPEETMAKVIPFPTRKVVEQEIETLEVNENCVQDLIIAISSINMATRYRGKFDEQCRESLEKDNFPCSENCGCYSHMLSSMALELIFEGDRSEDARKHLYKEYATLCSKRLPIISDDED